MNPPALERVGFGIPRQAYVRRVRFGGSSGHQANPMAHCHESARRKCGLKVLFTLHLAIEHEVTITEARLATIIKRLRKGRSARMRSTSSEWLRANVLGRGPLGAFVCTWRDGKQMVKNDRGRQRTLFWRRWRTTSRRGCSGG